MYFVDRSVVVLKPTQDFLDWLNQTNSDDMPDLTLNQIRSNCTTFLIPQFDEPEQAAKTPTERRLTPAKANTLLFFIRILQFCFLGLLRIIAQESKKVN